MLFLKIFAQCRRPERRPRPRGPRCALSGRRRVSSAGVRSAFLWPRATALSLVVPETQHVDVYQFDLRGSDRYRMRQYEERRFAVCRSPLCGTATTRRRTASRMPAPMVRSASVCDRSTRAGLFQTRLAHNFGGRSVNFPDFF